MRTSSKRNHFIAGAALALMASSCSMKDRDVNYGISVSLPTSRVSSSAMSSAQISGGSAPTSINDFQCFALNVTGPGLKSDPRFGCNDPSKANMGLIAGMAPVSGGKIDALVPAGAARTIQLIGLQSTVGCPSFETLLATIDPTTGQGGMAGVGDPYLLGQTTIDVFGDVTVNIRAQFDPAAKMFQGCGGNGESQLLFQQANMSRAKLRGTGTSSCRPFAMEAHKNSNTGYPSAVTPKIVSTVGTGSVTFYTDSGCTSVWDSAANPAPTPFNFAAVNMGHIPLWIKVGSGITSFDAQLDSTDTTWKSPVQTFTAVDSAMGLLLPSPTPAVSQGTAITSCASIPLYLIDANGSMTGYPVALDIDFRVYNNSTNGAVPSSIEVYTDATLCANGTTGRLIPQAATANDHETKYILNFPGSPTTIYVRNSVPEMLSLAFSIVNGSSEGIITGMSFLPFTPITSGTPPPPFYRGLDGGAAGNLTIGIPVITGGASVTSVMVGSKLATIISKTDTLVTILAPSVSAAEQVASQYAGISIGAQVGNQTVYAYTNMSVNYAPFDSGDGTATYPFTVATVSQFKHVGDSSWTGKQFIQIANLDFSAEPATGNYLVANFSGTYNGQGGTFSILNLTDPLFQTCSGQIQSLSVTFNGSISSTNSYLGVVCGTLNGQLHTVSVSGSGTLAASGISPVAGGLVGYVPSGGSIYGSNVQGINIDASQSSSMAGGLAGRLEGTITNSFTQGVNLSSSGSTPTLGGLVGYMSLAPSIIDTCRVSGGSISATISGGMVGGLIGVLSDGTVIRSYASLGNLSATTGMYVGGAIGLMNAGSVSESFVSQLGTTAVNGPTSNSSAATGGFVGKVVAGSIFNSFAKTDVSGYNNVGGFVGSMFGGALSFNYAYSNTVSGTSTAFGFVGQKSAGTIAAGYYRPNAGITTDVAAGVTSIPTNQDSLSNYGSFSASYWKQNVSTPSGSSNTPVLTWSCGAATPMNLTCF